MKINEIKEKAIDELKEMIVNSKKELFSLRMKQNKMTPLENPSQLKKLRKEIAQMKTILRQKEINA